MALGHSPDVWFGRILKRCFEAQLDGVFDTEDEGIAFAQRLVEELKL